MNNKNQWIDQTANDIEKMAQITEQLVMDYSKKRT